ncbi:hypothetical protein NHF46_18460 [Arthrobacter alpinus]|nr:hypothetical protein [Arthrobacter alpinus]
MAISKQQVPAGTLRTASIIILAFAAAVLLFGLNMFQVGSNPGVLPGSCRGQGCLGLSPMPGSMWAMAVTGYSTSFAWN